MMPARVARNVTTTMTGFGQENDMQIQINTDSSIEGNEELATHVKGVVQGVLSPFSDHITRVEVHLSDDNGGKGGVDDKRCMMEARLEGRQPTTATHLAAIMGDAVEGAADQLRQSLETMFERQNEVRRK